MYNYSHSLLPSSRLNANREKLASQFRLWLCHLRFMSDHQLKRFQTAQSPQLLGFSVIAVQQPINVEFDVKVISAKSQKIPLKLHALDRSAAYNIDPMTESKGGSRDLVDLQHNQTTVCCPNDVGANYKWVEIEGLETAHWIIYLFTNTAGVEDY